MIPVCQPDTAAYTYEKMKRATTRIRQLVIGIVAVLSLSVSSVAACACNHHLQSPTEELSCHGRSKKQHHDTADAPLLPSAGETCACVRSAAKESVKAEAFKWKKQAMHFAGFDLPDTEYSLINSVAIRFERTAVPTRTFSDSCSSRGPPLS